MRVAILDDLGNVLIKQLGLLIPTPITRETVGHAAENES